MLAEQLRKITDEANISFNTKATKEFPYVWKKIEKILTDEAKLGRSASTIHLDRFLAYGKQVNVIIIERLKEKFKQENITWTQIEDDDDLIQVTWHIDELEM